MYGPGTWVTHFSAENDDFSRHHIDIQLPSRLFGPLETGCRARKSLEKKGNSMCYPCLRTPVTHVPSLYNSTEGGHARVHASRLRDIRHGVALIGSLGVHSSLHTGSRGDVDDERRGAVVAFWGGAEARQANSVATRSVTVPTILIVGHGSSSSGFGAGIREDFASQRFTP